MLQDRNRTSHTYDEASALDIFDTIQNVYVDVFEKFINNLEKEL